MLGLAVIRKTEGGYTVYSHKTGKKLSKAGMSLAQARKRLSQIRFFNKKRG